MKLPVLLACSTLVGCANLYEPSEYNHTDPNRTFVTEHATVLNVDVARVDRTLFSPAKLAYSLTVEIDKSPQEQYSKERTITVIQLVEPDREFYRDQRVYVIYSTSGIRILPQ